MLFCLLMLTLLPVSLGIPVENSKLLSRSKRLIKASSNSRWDKGIIPYVFDSELSSNKQNEYLNVIFPIYEKFSCIRFVPWTDTSNKYLDHDNYLIFDQKTNQCSSKVGNTRRRGQTITCCTGNTCIHEIGHALGMYHEHTSPIRDDFARINYENIVSGLFNQFTVEGSNVETFDIYDFDSIMHYGLKAFTSEGEQTITFFDPDTRPSSKFANKEQFFYFFQQINEAYNCTDECSSLTCHNGGYKAMVNGNCKCRCPEGLNASNNCKTLRSTECGEVVKLDESNLVVTIDSPVFENRINPVRCHWYIQSPPNTKILLDFPTFNIREGNDGCIDEVAVKPYLQGMYGTSYCGSVYKKTTQSYENFLGFSFTQNYTSSTVSTFKAKVSYVDESSFCYDVNNKGVNYAGDVTFADDSSKCLHWDRVTNCRHHLFNIHDGDKGLVGNECRNPDNSAGPWCYTDSTNCVRRYCDACNLGVCKNIFGNCGSKIRKNPNYCSTYIGASNCRRACNFCDNHQPLPSVSETKCAAPKLPADAVQATLENEYNVGDQVKVECGTDAVQHQYITCLSSGTWSELNFVCGTCLPGWHNYGKNCYKLFDNLLGYNAAANFCDSQPIPSTLLIESNENHNFVTELIKNEQGYCRTIWLGLSMAVDTNTLIWPDGEQVDWTNWDNNEPGRQSHFSINSNCKWEDKWYKNQQRFVCQYERSDAKLCANQRSDCATIIRRNSDICTSQRKGFAKTYCAKACNLC